METLAEQREGQPIMMIIEGEDAGCGHWYSPAAVAEMIAAEREACAALCCEVAAGRDAEAIADAIRGRK